MEPRIPPKVPADVADCTSSLNPEAEDRFELELCWCVQQLEASLATGKLQEKQAQELGKHLHTLRSNSAPLIKKRQIMRNTFGDYRQKMAEDERKLNKTVSSVRFTSTAAMDKKSIFIKKATSHSDRSLQEFQKQTDDRETQDQSASAKQSASVGVNRTQTPFKFNFQTCQ